MPLCLRPDTLMAAVGRMFAVNGCGSRRTAVGGGKPIVNPTPGMVPRVTMRPLRLIRRIAGCRRFRADGAGVVPGWEQDQARGQELEGQAPVGQVPVE